ncbi:MAG: hypothetical protein C4523_14815 [Myxococcales bacterium]|nr:MAG: hypothetical protein C4523_14815 [Myxococcales bacterium]
MSALQILFAVCAGTGGLAFLIWLILQLIGVAHDIGPHADVPADVDASHAGSDTSFKLLSFQGVSAFLMMFGLVGLILLQTDQGEVVATIGALVAGGFALWLIARIFSLFKSLQSSGTIDMRRAVGQTGSVYLTISPKGTGKVQVTVQSRLMEFAAVSESGEELRTGEQVRVVRLINDSTLSVERLSAAAPPL